MTDFNTMLRSFQLRPTRQRLQLCKILFNGEHRHLSAEQLRSEIRDHGSNMSLATIYTTLNQFTDVGLLREIKLEDGISYFDTNNTHHHHFYDTATGALIDIPHEEISINNLPSAPEGKDIERIDIVIRVS